MNAELENIIPGLREARAEERLNRALAFAGLTRTVCGVELVPLTPRHRLALQLVQNAFACGPATLPLAGDVFAFLWLLSASYGPPSVLPNPVRAFRQWKLRRHVRRLDLPRAVREIQETLAAQLQDRPETGAEERGWNAETSVHWMAAEASFWVNIHGGFTLESYLSTPYLVLQQLLRAYRMNHPKVSYERDGTAVVEDVSFINASDRLIGNWQRLNAARIREIILSRRERLAN